MRRITPKFKLLFGNCNDLIYLFSGVQSNDLHSFIILNFAAGDSLSNGLQYLRGGRSRLSREIERNPKTSSVP